MKKSLIALLLVAMIVVLPCIAMAAVDYANNTDPSDALDPQDSAWLYYKPAVTIKTETSAPAADVVIPASGVASFAVIASVVATLGCAVLPKK
ncbi:MAG: hypothetical protein E7334_06900 [Clostridiales bacterium]|nr:hypothetical protein [Clostridiales bacterium]